MAKNVTINFTTTDGSSSLPTFNAGEIIRGILSFKVTKEIRLGKGLLVEFMGKARAQFGSGNSRRYEKEIFFDNHNWLLKRGVNGSNLSLSSRDHQFNLTCDLPQNLPSSFKSTHGEIYYQVEVTIFTLNFLSAPIPKPKIFKFPFKVIGHRLIPNPQNWRQCQLIEFADSYKVWTPSFENWNWTQLLAMSTINWLVRLPRSQFLAGEILEFSVDIDNRSPQILEKISITLMQEVNYIANGPCAGASYESRNEMTRQDFIQNIKGPSATSCVDKLLLPGHLRVTTSDRFGIESCSIIKIKYLIEFKVKVGVYKLRKEFPIIIGNGVEASS